MASIRANPMMDPETEAKRLYHAMKGRGCNEEEIIQVLTSCSEKQRELIKLQYKKTYGDDLVETLKKELKGNLETAIIGLVTPRRLYVVEQIHDAFKGIGAKEENLIDLLIPNSKSELSDIIDLYRNCYGVNLADAVARELSGAPGLRSVLLAHLTLDRDSGSSDSKASQRARQLKEALKESKWDEDDDFAYIFNTSSFEDLRSIAGLFESMTGKSLESVIRDKVKGKQYEAGLVALVRSSLSVPGYYADRLSDAMAGRGCDEKTLIRILLLRAEVDMQEVKGQYRHKFGRNLEDAIKSETKGDLRTMALALV